MPCFFLISGLLFRMKNDSFKDTVLHRIRTLLVPYFILSVLFVFLNPNNYQGNVLLSFRTNIWDILMGNSGFMTVSLWFVYVLFEVCVATVALHQITKGLSEPMQRWIVVAAMAGCIMMDALFHGTLLPCKLSDFFIAWSMYLLGYRLRQYLNSVQNLSIPWLVVFAGLLSACSFFLFGIKSPADCFLSEIHRIGLILSGSFSLLSIIIILTRAIPENFIGTSLRYLSNNALCFLAVHMWVICLCQQYMPHYNPYHAATLGLTASLILMPLAKPLKKTDHA